MTRERRVLGHYSQLLLPLEDPLPVGIPTVVKLALVAVGPLFWDLMRSVHRPGSEIEEEGLVWSKLLGIGDKLDCLVHEVGSQVVALLGGPGRIDLVIIVDQIRVVLAGVAAEEPVEAIKA